MKTKRTINHPKNQSGLTLIELVISIVIISIIGLSLSNYLLNSVKTYMATEKNITALTKSQLIDKRIELELREVDFNLGAYSITTSSNTTVAFTNAYSAKLIEINYDGVANNLELNYDGVTTILSDNITAFDLNYYDADGNPTAIVADMIFIEYNYNITEDGITYSSIGRVMLRDKQ